ncbi:unnamed protein product [Effrenium voratum]|nr:unnamed protein product [Effrenium voratum]
MKVAKRTSVPRIGWSSVPQADDQKQEVREVVLFDSGTAKDLPKDPRLRVQPGDITDPAQCEKLVDEDGMVVFHLASVMSGQGEEDFDLCWRVNMEGTRNLLEACRRRRNSKFIFASSGACFGERAAGPERDDTKLLPRTSYGMTKACCELMINDYTRRNFLDGRTARLPTVIPRPEVNSGLPGAFSTVIREPLKGQSCVLNLSPDMKHAVCGFRVLARNLLHLADLPQAALSDSMDRAMNLPCLSLSLSDLEQAVASVVQDTAKLGKVSYAPDPALCEKLGSFHRDMDATRARQLGMVADSSAAAIAADFAAEYVDAALLKPIVELPQEPRHWLVFSNSHLRVFRVENAPGDTTLMHVHRVDSLYFFYTPSSVQNTKWQEAPMDDLLQVGEVRYGDHGNCTLTHRIHNKARPLMMCLDVELAGFEAVRHAKRQKTEPPSVAGLKLIKERPAARVYKLSLDAGAKGSFALPFQRMLLLVHKGARVTGLGRGLLKPGDVFFQEGPMELTLEVIGSRHALSLWLVELLY